VKKNIDVIIPIYGDFEATKNCVESVLKYLDDGQNLVLINDKSPEKAITKYLQGVKKAYPKVTLIEHKVNVGFVKTVNEGMALSKDHDVILLNCDTVVTKNWANKMRDRAYELENVATVTPFSNSGGNFSFPKFLTKNELPKYTTPEDMNFVFSLIPKTIIESPTGMGYCMYVTRKAINKLGLFDVETFGKGYGEECDFMLRALKKGFVNLALENTFIYHVDGASFGEEKQKIILENWNKLFEKHPDFKEIVLDFEKRDPLKIIRNRAKIILNIFYPLFVAKYYIKRLVK
jgi:GT2 family glycosyltransferase